MTKIQGRKKNKLCMLEDEKVCDNCLECNTCDLDPGKICDNCAKCIDIDSDLDYRVIEIDDIIVEKDLKRKLAIVDKKKTEKNKSQGQNET